MCGEQLKKSMALHLKWGSSPRVRGTASLSNKIDNIEGIIPACAGNSPALALRLTQERDHPRVCGEQRLKYISLRLNKGSSPRVRGTVFLNQRIQIQARIIPACAGNSCRSISERPCARDHPRVCGEQTKDPQLNITHPS